MMLSPSTVSATTFGPAAGGGITTSRNAPSCTRSDFAGATPSSITSPAATSSAALVRDSPNSREIAASTRSPARPLGTCSTFEGCLAGRVSEVSLTSRATPLPDPRRPVRPSMPMPRRLSSTNSTAATRDRAVGDVEDRPVRQLDEVDDLAPERRRVAEDAVGDVAERATEDQPERDRPGPAAQPAAKLDHDHDDGERDHGQHDRVAGAGTEGRARVVHQPELQQLADDLPRLAVGQRVLGPPLGGLVEQETQSARQ